jgi:hypothetical protein
MSKNGFTKLGAGLYRLDIPSDAHAFDLHSDKLYYWRIRGKDVVVDLPFIGYWSIEKTCEDYLILKFDSGIKSKQRKL